MRYLGKNTRNQNKGHRHRLAGAFSDHAPAPTQGLRITTDGAYFPLEENRAGGAACWHDSEGGLHVNAYNLSGYHFVDAFQAELRTVTLALRDAPGGRVTQLFTDCMSVVDCAADIRRGRLPRSAFYDPLLGDLRHALRRQPNADIVHEYRNDGLVPIVHRAGRAAAFEDTKGLWRVKRDFSAASLNLVSSDGERLEIRRVSAPQFGIPVEKRLESAYH